MDREPEDKRILIVDQHEHWRESSADALRRKGYSVLTTGDYDYFAGMAYFDGKPLDLVILGCARIRRDEQEFIAKVIADHRHLVVLCTSLPWDDMRSLFLKGAIDVADKTHNPDHLINIVEEVFDSEASRDGNEYWPETSREAI